MMIRLTTHPAKAPEMTVIRNMAVFRPSLGIERSIKNTFLIQIISTFHSTNQANPRSVPAAMKREERIMFFVIV